MLNFFGKLQERTFRTSAPEVKEERSEQRVEREDKEIVFSKSDNEILRLKLMQTHMFILFSI
jgi:hypothetical protein